MIDALDTLYIMELEEEFQEAKQWVEQSFDLNVVSQLLAVPVSPKVSHHSPPVSPRGENLSSGGIKTTQLMVFSLRPKEQCRN